MTGSPAIDPLPVMIDQFRALAFSFCKHFGLQPDEVAEIMVGVACEFDTGDWSLNDTVSPLGEPLVWQAAR